MWQADLEHMKSRIRRLASSPAAITFLLAPVVGELISTSAPLPGFLVGWPPFAVLYGCGVLLVREVAHRWGSGWLGVGLLGAAYGIVEEGLVTRAFFDPTWEDLGKLAVFGRDGGVNWLWATQLTIYHAAVSVGVTLTVAGLLFPDRREEPWLGRRGLGWSAAGIGAWVLAGFAFYRPPAPHLAATWVAVAVLVVAARLVRPRPPRPSTGPVPRPRRFLLLGVAAWVTVMLLPHLFAEIPGTSPEAAWLLMVGSALGAVALVRTWSGDMTAWDDRHRLALAFGIMAPFVALGPVFAGPVWGSIVTVATLWASWRLWRRVGGRAPSTLDAEGSISVPEDDQSRQS